MSSNEDDFNDADTPVNQGLKKRRVQRACDICRRKKIRCDGVQMPGHRCSNCVSYRLECTYVEASKKRGPSKGYVENLENRVEKLDKLLRKLVPDDTLVKELQDAMDKEWVPHDPSPLVATQQQPTFFQGIGDSLTSPDDLVAAISVVTDGLGQVAIEPDQYRFFGKSGTTGLIEAAIDLKAEYTQLAEPFLKETITPKFSRTKVGGLRDWELKPDQPSPQYTFPEADLASSLVDLYFSNINLCQPLLHRPTFEKSVAEGLHYKDELFASTYLLVCAVGSYFSDDRRVFLDEFDTSDSCGWKWFNQVQMVKRSFLEPPTLYDLQFYCLSVHFLQGTSAPQSSWTIAGIGLRLAQDVGAHQRKGQALTAENEQWNRAFWILVCMDKLISAALGRPCAIHDEDFDVDLPVDCDDEYWDHPDPEQRFKQPENKPSLISAFILYIKLNQILSKCLTIHTIKQSKILSGYIRQQWEQDIVAQLDSSLNQWVDTIPDHLRWDPNRQNPDFFNQSASLYVIYYYIQILIHRPYITKPSPLSYPSLAICTNAARSCSHIADMMRRSNVIPQVYTSIPIFTAGVVLLLNIWGGKRSGLSVDPNKEMTDVRKCMKILMVIERRWRAVRGLWDLLCRLTSAGGLPFPQPSPMAMNKRERGCDKPITASFSESSQPMIQDDTPRMITGSRRRVNKDLPDPRLSKRTDQLHHQSNRRYQLPSMSSSQSQLEQPNQNQQHPDPSTTFPTPFTRTYTLPMYSDELGRLPLHGHLNSSAPYLDQTNDGYPNRGSSAVGGSSEGNANPDHTVLSNASTSSYLSQHSNRRQYQQAQDHNHHPPITIRTMTPIGPKQAQWHQNSPLNQRWDREV